MEAEAVEEAVAALRAHPQEARVQMGGCFALSHVCHGTDAEALARKQRAAAAGAGPAVTAAMQAHPYHSEVQHFGQLLLQSLP